MRSTFACLSLIALALAAPACTASTGERSSSSADALQEGPDYQTTIDTVVNPWCQAQGQYGTFSGVAGVPIAYASFEVPNEKGAIVLLPGRTEAFIKYCELLWDWKNQGYSVYLMDHRGQGQSGRMLPDHEKGYVHEFGDYVTDVETFMATIVTAKPHAKKYLLAHSMGGAISTLYLERHPNDFDAAVLSSPMLQINTSPYAEWEAMSIVTAETFVGLGNSYVLGKGPWDPNETFEKNTVTHSRDRWTMNHELWIAHPEVDLGGPTNNWLHQSIEADWNARLWAGSITTPTLVMKAGQDQVVVTAPEDEVCSKAKACTLLTFPTAGHEILQETDDIREAAMSAALSFFASH
jgi:lysophospholipase